MELKTEEGWFFQRVDLCIWAIGGHELGTLSIPVHNSLTVYDNSWALKFDNFSEFQNAISDCYNIQQKETGFKSSDLKVFSKITALENFSKIFKL